MLFVQRITTESTKASRGGSAAAKRNAVPLGLRLPHTDSSDAERVLHHARHRERNAFAREESFEAIEASSLIRIEPVWLYVESELICVHYNWTWEECGAPERRRQHAFDLAPGEWGRLLCNGRFGGDQNWFYRFSVFNIAWRPKGDPWLFVRTSPKRGVRHLARLR